MRDRPTSVMLFSAGLGTRMKHLTAHRPKPLIEVNGKALIDYALDIANEINPQTILANLHYLPHMLVDHLAGTDVKTLIEAPDVLETGGGLKNALPHLGQGPVMTMNTDTIWKGPNPLQMALDAWNPEIMDALLVCVPVSQTIGYNGNGDFSIDPQGHLSRGGRFVYGGAQIVKTDRLSSIQENNFSLNILWNQMLKDKTLYGLPYSGQWCDVGHPEGIPLAERLLDAKN